MRVVQILRVAAATLVLAATAAAAGAAATRVTPIDAGDFRDVLAAHRGQVVLVNFWATWCRPCLKEIPELRALEQRYGERGLRLVLVSLDEPGDRDGVVEPFLTRWFPGLSTYARRTPDMDSMVSVVDPAWNEVLPTSYVLDREGKVQVRIQGVKTAAEFEAAVLPWIGGG